MPTPSSPAIVDAPLPYVDQLERRPLAQVDLVVVHCTELPDLATARAYGERVLYASGTGNSGHYYVDRDGTVLRYVPDDRTAHHVRGCNTRAIGIELVNSGRFPHWLDSRHQAMDEAYPDAQIDALVALLRHLAVRLPALRHIAGHEDLDREQVPASDDPSVRVQRKLDPGPLFPWPRVLAQVPLQRLPL
ncbi:N-acetylmuramoyl-L-alanine amidase [Pseudoxanthomonas suwonensis]|uniref:N-acetylmuramoyl-L-alanine amidase n=1 Tax=Pseudoxanthomonas suwonensis TaxID=314722 RepID=A0A0E3ULW2_9GAMM|nr:N-acetylmuramoyl-L-alanine amidase [Pseudoxanthomonas suwonensis]AKC85826.1 N-acetylmuramoyl-L-alanine amidase [Pseudoxanthomonas suwonensis]